MMGKATQTAEDRTYNGHTNYETWCVGLWLGNEEGPYNHCRELARECKENAGEDRRVREKIWTEEQAARFNTADAIREYVEECHKPELPASMASDMLNAAFAEVDWNDVAEGFLEE